MSGYDLHSHSSASDGSLSPAELVARAAAKGVEVLALTDHDTVAGVAQALEAAAAVAAPAVVPGVEVSVTWHDHLVHVVGLRVDPHSPVLEGGLSRLRGLRHERAEEIARRLARIGVGGALEEIRGRCGAESITRTHFARYLVERGRAKSPAAAFRHFLGRGQSAYVGVSWAALDEAVDWIRQAGGHAVIAHPGRYRLTATRLRRLLAAFRDCGGEALEVSYGGCGPQELREHAELARRHELLGSRGSDFHVPGEVWSELGAAPPLPSGVRPVWTLWEEGPAR